MSEAPKDPVVPPEELERRRAAEAQRAAEQAEAERQAAAAEAERLAAEDDESEEEPDESHDGYFEVTAGTDDPYDIDFAVCRNDVPTDLLRLKSDIERTLSALRVLYLHDGDPNDDKVKRKNAKYMAANTKLLSLAQVGLGETGAPEVAREALASLHAEILDREAGVIKNRYLVRLGGYAAAFGAVALIARLIIEFWRPEGALAFLTTRTS